MEPASALPDYCRGLNQFTDADVRAPQQWSIEPSDMLLAGGHVAMVVPVGDALRVLDAAGDCRSVFASWGAARSAVFRLVVEWEVDARLKAA